MDVEDFNIDKVDWHLKVERNYEFDRRKVLEAFKNIFIFLQQNGLSTKRLLGPDDIITPDTSLRRTDLTDEGYLLIKKAYSTWMDKVVDGKIEPTDFRILSKALLRIRGEH